MFFSEQHDTSVPLIPLSPKSLKTWRKTQSSLWSNLLKINDFQAKDHQLCLLTNDQGELGCVLIGVAEDANKRWSLAKIVTQLPRGNYHLDSDWSEADIVQAMVGWGLGCYTFDTYKYAKTDTNTAHIYVEQTLLVAINAFIDAIYLVRDLINTPANYMMPEHLSHITSKLAQQFSANFTEVVGDALLEDNLPTIHAVGRASSHPPRYLEMTWGDNHHPRITLIGKGVCFDSGGLDLKPSRFMRLMKKDMGGAAHALGLAHLIMANQLPINLRVLIPAVENAVSGDAFRPGDVIRTRSGKTVEIDNTDAEGRLVLCDAITDAIADDPDLIIDFATLTGAARVALGTDVPVYFSNDTALSQALNEHAETQQELVWQLPLYKEYLKQLDSDYADLLNCSPEGYGGAITAALFLNEFVPEQRKWLHFDVMAWNNKNRVGRPKGGEAMGLFSLYSYLHATYSD